jgi:hypothetical protein
MNETDPSPWEVDFGLTAGAVRHLDDVAWAGMDGRESARDVATKRGLKLLDSGTYRAVFVPTEVFAGIQGHEDVVFKVGIGKAGWHNNGDEIDTWLSSTQPLRNCLLPVIAHHDRGGWVAQPKADETVTNASLKGTRECIRKTDYRCRDLNIGNTGTWRGEHVMVDYGAGCFESGLGNRYSGRDRSEFFGDKE